MHPLNLLQIDEMTVAHLHLTVLFDLARPMLQLLSSAKLQGDIIEI